MCCWRRIGESFGQSVKNEGMHRVKGERNTICTTEEGSLTGL